MMRKTLLSLMVLAILVMMAVPAFAADDYADMPPVFDDGRINNYDLAAPVAVFGTDFETGRGLEIWTPTYFEGTSELALRVTPEEIAAVSETPEEATLIDASTDNGIRLYRLPDGAFQLWAINQNSEWYSLTFDVLGPNTGYTSEYVK
jgi:hypothetical protein